jgi:tetratricopeptide (TPR) repeat protein
MSNAFDSTLASRLHAENRQSELCTLLTAFPDWMNNRLQQPDGDKDYLKDVDLAIGMFSDPLTPEQVLNLAQLWAARQIGSLWSNRYNNTHLKTLVLLDREAEALTYARRLQDSIARFLALLTIYEAHQGEKDAALRQELLAAAQKIEGDDNQGDALAKVVFVMVRAKQLDEALKLAKSIVVDYRRADGLTSVGAALLKTEQSAQGEALLDEAMNLLNASPANWWQKGEIGRDIADAFAKAKQHEKALNIARQIDFQPKKSAALQWLATNIWRNGDVALGNAVADEALAIGRTDHTWGNWRGWMLGGVVLTLTNIDRSFEALTVLSEIEEIPRRIGVAGKMIVLLLPKHKTQADAAINDAMNLAKTLRNKYEKASGWRNLAVEIAPVAERKVMLKIMRELVASAQKLDSDNDKAEFLGSAALAYAQMGEKQEATTMLDKSVEMRSSSESLKPIVRMYAHVAAALGRAGKKEHFKTALDYGVSIAKSHEHEAHRMGLMGEMGQILARGGQTKAGTDLVYQIKKNSLQMEALEKVAFALTELGQVDEAIQLGYIYKRAMNNSQALYNIAIKLIEMGKIDDVQEILQGSSTSASKMDVLQVLVEAFVRDGKHDEAQKIIKRYKVATMNCSLLEFSRARAFIKLGKLTEAKEILNRVVPMLSQFHDEYHHRIGLKAITLFAQAQEFDEAYSRIIALITPYARPDALKIIAMELAKAGQTDKAVQLAEEIKHSYSPQYWLPTKARVLAICGKLEEALAVARQIGNLQNYWLTGEIAVLYAKAGQSARAWKIIAGVDQGHREEALQIFNKGLQEIAKDHAKQHAFVKAFQVIHQFGHVDFTLSIADWYEIFEALEAGLTLKVMREVARIIGWERGRWQEISEWLA